MLTPGVLAALPPPLQLGDDAQAVTYWRDQRVLESDVYTIRDINRQAIGLLIVHESLDAGKPVAHIGYLFGQNSWGQGYATELLLGVISAITGRGQITIFAGVALDNPASAHVLRKVGFERLPDQSTGETDMFVLHIAR